jgi:hypothetical protein
MTVPMDLERALLRWNAMKVHGVLLLTSQVFHVSLRTDGTAPPHASYHDQASVSRMGTV